MTYCLSLFSRMARWCMKELILHYQLLQIRPFHFIIKLSHIIFIPSAQQHICMVQIQKMTWSPWCQSHYSKQTHHNRHIFFCCLQAKSLHLDFCCFQLEEHFLCSALFFVLFLLFVQSKICWITSWKSLVEASYPGHCKSSWAVKTP